MSINSDHSTPQLVDTVIHDTCMDVVGRMQIGSADILTDPPYITRYRLRDGQGVRNDDNDRWIVPTFAKAYRVLKPGGFGVSFFS